MKYKLLEKRELRVSELFRNNDNWRRFGYLFERNIQGRIKKIFNLFMQADGNYIDTANIYQNGTSEKYVGEFIAPDRD